MASSVDFVEYVCDQIREAGCITYRKMFGDYCVYCEGKPIGLICDNTFFVKKTEAGAKVIPNMDEAPPYDGAKPQFVVDNLDDRELVCELVRKSYEELPMPKPKKKKAK